MYKEDRAQFWENIYLDNDAGWDLNGVTPIFEYFSNQLTPARLVSLDVGLVMMQLCLRIKALRLQQLIFLNQP